jgi:antitoxin (DNA-binding transcriptional repressor) of toxin-antitoxin stability system
METTKVGIREFRADLAEYIASKTPVAVTRHGRTVGYFIPTQGQMEAAIAALRKASVSLDKMLAEHGMDIEGVVADFKAAKASASPIKNPVRVLPGQQSHRIAGQIQAGTAWLLPRQG